MFIHFQCPESEVAQCPLLVKTEVDSITVKEESPDKCVTQEGGKTLHASKQHESQSDTSEQSSDECKVTDEKSQNTVEMVSDPQETKDSGEKLQSENGEKCTGAQEIQNSEVPVQNEVKEAINVNEQPKETQDSELSAHSEKCDADISKEVQEVASNKTKIIELLQRPQDEASGISNTTHVSKEIDIMCKSNPTEENPCEMTPTECIDS